MTQLLFWISLMVFTGCSNRPGGPFGTSARIPAPGTYQLKIPSLANNQPYYTPNQGSTLAGNSNNPPSINPPSTPINPNAAAPTVVANRDLQGWKLTNQQPVPQSNAPVYQSPNTISANFPYATSNLQVASGTTVTNPENGGRTLAGQMNPERFDATRMAAIDASSIRPPAAVTNQQQYFGRLHTSGGINPGPIQNPAPTSNGFSQPQLPNRYAAQPVVGTPGSYQSPYIRGGIYVPGTDPRVGATGWVAREGAPQANR